MNRYLNEDDEMDDEMLTSRMYAKIKEEKAYFKKMREYKKNEDNMHDRFQFADVWTVPDKKVHFDGLRLQDQFHGGSKR